MNKYTYGMIISLIITVIGLVLLVYQTMITKSVGVHVEYIPRIGILYAFIFSIGAIAAMAIAGLNTHEGKSEKKK
ncbi:MAG: hypothetical protein ACP5UV_02220 [Thermoplasmata archaeon]